MNGKYEFIRFKWETENEANYRFKIYQLSNEAAIALSDSENVAKMKVPNYRPILNKMTKISDEFKAMTVPENYKESHNLLIEGYSYYIKGYDLLCNEFKIGKRILDSNKEMSYDNNVISKATLFLTVANSYMKIVGCKNSEYFFKCEKEGKMN